MIPLVSIVIPIYNVEKFLERCLHSVAKQTYPNIECFLIDDCSPDGSMEIARNFIKKHSASHFTIIEQPKNRGLSMARNAGMDAAKGKYIYFLDSDDEITPAAIEHLVKIAEETDAQMVLGHSVCINEEEEWKRDYFPVTSEKDVLYGNKEVLRYFVEGKYPVMACDKLTRMDFLMENNLYFVQDLFSQDVLWSFQSALKLEKVAFLREDTYLYYFHGASIIHNRGERHFKNWITIAQYMDRAYRNEKDSFKKEMILKYLVEFKAMTLEMNWKAQKNEKLWKYSYSAYSKLNSLGISEMLSKNYPKKLKRQNLFISLPVYWGFKLFKWRYER